MNQKIIHIFFDIDMRNQHDGLKILAHKKNVDVEALNNNQHVIFINKSLNRLKMYSSKGVLSYIKSKNIFDLDAIKYIPEAFANDDVELIYTKALKKTLEKKLKRNNHNENKN